MLYGERCEDCNKTHSGVPSVINLILIQLEQIIHTYLLNTRLNPYRFYIRDNYYVIKGLKTVWRKILRLRVFVQLCCKLHLTNCLMANRIVNIMFELIEFSNLHSINRCLTKKKNIRKFSIINIFLTVISEAFKNFQNYPTAD